MEQYIYRCLCICRSVCVPVRGVQVESSKDKWWTTATQRIKRNCWEMLFRANLEIEYWANKNDEHYRILAPPVIYLLHLIFHLYFPVPLLWSSSLFFVRTFINSTHLFSDSLTTPFRVALIKWNFRRHFLCLFGTLEGIIDDEEENGKKIVCYSHMHTENERGRRSCVI